MSIEGMAIAADEKQIGGFVVVLGAVFVCSRGARRESVSKQVGSVYAFAHMGIGHVEGYRICFRRSDMKKGSEEKEAD